jgi:hypothetical protein
MMSGFNCGPEIYLSKDEKNSIIFKLANNDFDVWVLNNRANRFNREHLNIDPDKDPR